MNKNVLKHLSSFQKRCKLFLKKMLYSSPFIKYTRFVKNLSNSKIKNTYETFRILKNCLNPSLHLFMDIFGQLDSTVKNSISIQ